MHRSLIPNVTPPPPPGYTLHQLLPLDRLREHVVAPDADILVSRSVFSGSREARRDESVLVLRDGAWRESAGGAWELDSPVSDEAWRAGDDVPFVETSIRVDDGPGFRSMFAPAFYTVFDGDARKSFFNDNALKFANTIVVYQIEAFGNWMEGYPACRVDPAHDIDQSALLINPHDMPAVVSVELEGAGEPRRVRVPAHSARRYSFSAALGQDVPWSGQALVWGPNRVNLFFLSHSHGDPADVVTMEHSEVYRGERAFVPMLEQPMRRLYAWKRRVIDRAVR
ncbi:MAG: hypothetical protein AB7N54_04155 [Alphaproteobacteria bacterium]